MARPHLKLDGGRWKLWRLADDEFVTLGHHALPLAPNEALLVQRSHRPLARGGGISLAHWLTSLERHFGPSSPLFDASHGSFSFPLLLTFGREQRVTCVLRCHDHRGTFYMPLYRVVSGDPSVEERSRWHPAAAGEMSDGELDEFVLAFHQQLRSTADTLEHALVSPFYRAIPSDIILYGYDGVQFFEHRYRRLNEYEQARQQFEKRLGHRRARSSSNRVERLIDQVTES